MSYRHTLLPYSGPASRRTCPSCGAKREFALYLDTETGELLPDHVGRCNRELNCGYHYTPKQYFDEQGLIRPTQPYKQPKKEEARPIDYMPLNYVEASVRLFHKNNLFRFMELLFTPLVARSLFLKYMVGTSRHWPGATVFWQIDAKEKVRAGKIMLYDRTTGKRVREPFNHITWVHSVLKKPEYTLQQCFFGEHLLSEHPDKTVCLVESEKTALICSIYFPDMLWIASGGKNGCQWYDQKVNQVLRGRKVVLFPDADAFEKWNVKAAEINKCQGFNLSVSDLIENGATEEQKKKGLDIADFLLKRCEKTGLALIDPGYPAIFDFKIDKHGAMVLH